MNKKELKKILREQNLKPIKRFGQNFLINSRVLKKISDLVKKQNPPWIEIGPGLGALTNHFEDKKKELLLVERDKKIANYWKNKSYQVLSADVLKLCWSKNFPEKSSLFGNLPYQIAGSLIIKSCFYQKQLNNMVLMLQKELAERITAKPKNKNYGLISVISQTFWSISLQFHLAQTDFYPQPKVQGSLLTFNKKKNLDINPILFLAFLKKSFAFKRKKLLKKLNVVEKNELKIKSLFKELKLSENCRAEELSLEQFQKLYYKLNEKMPIIHLNLK